MIRIWRYALLCGLVLAACDGNGGAGEQAAPPTVVANEWTILAHDSRSSFHNGAEKRISVESAGRMREAWSFEAAGAVTGTPAAAGGRVYALSTAAMYALDAQSGTVVWQNTAVRGTSSPSYADGKLYVNDGRSVLHRLDAITGEEEWSAVIDTHERASGFSSPVVAGGLVIVGSASTEEVVATDGATFRGGMVAFDLVTGREVWRHYTADPPHNGVAVWSSPSIDVDAGLVFGTTGNNYTGEAGPTSDSIFALDLESGALRWHRQLSEGDVFTIRNPRSEDSDFGTNPILFDVETGSGTRRLVGAGQKSGFFWVLDRMTGEVVWSREVSSGSALIGGVFNNGAYDGERIVLAGNNGISVGAGSEPANGKSEPLGAARTPTSVLTALDPATGNVLWERQLPAWVWAPITIANGVGFVSAETEVQAFDVATGAILFRMDTGGTISSGAAVAEGRVFFGSGVPYLGTQFDRRLHALELAN